MTLTAWIGLGILVLLLAGGVVAFFTIPAFKQWAKTKGKDAAIGLVKTYVLDQAKALVEQEYKNIAAKVLSGELKTKEAVKKELYRLGEILKGKTKARFSRELPALGDQVDELLDDLIRSAADKVSPFPGRETAAALLEHSVSDALISKGVDWLRENHLSVGD